MSAPAVDLFEDWAVPVTREYAYEWAFPASAMWDFAIEADDIMGAYRGMVAWFASNPHLLSGYERLGPHRMTECQGGFWNCPHPANESSPYHLWHIQREVTDLDKVKEWKGKRLGQLGLGL